MQTLRTPALWMVGASFAFAGMAACIKLASEEGVPTGQILFYRGAVALVLMSVYLRMRRIPIRTPHWQPQVTRALVSLVSMFLFVTSISLLPLATAVTLSYLSPLVLALVLMIFYRERAHPGMIVALCGGLVGVAMLLRPTFAASQWLGGAAGMTCAISGAVVALNMRKLGRLNEPPARTVTYFSLVITLGAAPSLLLTDAAAWTLQSATYLVSTGLLATVGQAMLTFAYKHGPTLLVSLLGYSQVIFTSLLAILIWNDHLSPLSWTGMALIIMSGAVATVTMRPRPKPE